MFVRKKRNKSGTISIQVIDKSRGRYRVSKTVGCTRNPDEVGRLYQKGQQIINNLHSNQLQLLPLKSATDLTIQNFTQDLANAQVRTIGPELIFGALFDQLGFGDIPDKLFRHLVIARLAYPTSKLKTVDYLYRYQGIKISPQTIYRFLDKLHSTYQDRVEQITFRHTQQTLGTINVIFYDMTTLYFEADDEDDLRKVGYSKDGKFNQPQIMIGLLVGQQGLPIGYDIYPGNTFEGHTLIPILDSIRDKYDLGRPVVIADSALLSRTNLRALDQAGYQYIVGGRIKNESQVIKDEILAKSKEMKNGDSFSIRRPDGNRLLVTYSSKRVAKYAHNRQRGLRRLEKKIRSGKLTKQQINNRGYNKFLTLEGEIKIDINQSKVRLDQRWDGLKGYVTNSRLWAKTIIKNYSQLWQIEKAFRISKTDLRIRPIYHYQQKRIEAHICIAFTAYTLYKELERRLKTNGVEISPARAGELTHTMYQLTYTLPNSNHSKHFILKMDSEQQLLYDVIHNWSFPRLVRVSQWWS